MTELQDVRATERQAVSFLCEVNQEDLEGRWYRGDARVRPGDHVRIRHQGGQGPGGGVWGLTRAPLHHGGPGEIQERS